MISIKKKANIFLIFAILFFIFFYGYYIFQNKGAIKIEDTKNIPLSKKSSDSNLGTTKFTDVEYKMSSQNNNEYVTRGKEAFTTKNKPNLIQLNVVNSFTTLKDGSVLNIKSDKAIYNKKTNNIKYYQNVLMTNKDKIITSDVANFFSNKNLIKLERAKYKDEKNLIKGDIVEFNTKTNNLEIHMKNKKDKVYGQRQTNK
tara:strand:+ start:14079 stop:14678 length:600 start_codon:yes stop_codon:yes gene_type:complete